MTCVLCKDAFTFYYNHPEDFPKKDYGELEKFIGDDEWPYVKDQIKECTCYKETCSSCLIKMISFNTKDDCHEFNCSTCCQKS